MFFNEFSLRAIHRPNANGQAFCMSTRGLSMFSASDFGFSMPLTRRRVQDVQARRVGQTKSDAKRQHIKGWEDGRKRTGPAGRPRMQGLDVESYAALAFLTAVDFAGFGWAFAAVFLTACAFSFAANSAFTFWVIASVSTL